MAESNRSRFSWTPTYFTTAHGEELDEDWREWYPTVRGTDLFANQSLMIPTDELLRREVYDVAWRMSGDRRTPPKEPKSMRTGGTVRRRLHPEVRMKRTLRKRRGYKPKRAFIGGIIKGIGEAVHDIYSSPVGGLALGALGIMQPELLPAIMAGGALSSLAAGDTKSALAQAGGVAQVAGGPRMQALGALAQQQAAMMPDQYQKKLLELQQEQMRRSFDISRNIPSSFTTATPGSLGFAAQQN